MSVRLRARPHALAALGALTLALQAWAPHAAAQIATCNQDADCDDLLACTGTEICFNGFCLLSGEEPCSGLPCQENGGSEVRCAGRELVARLQSGMSWNEDVSLDPALRLGFGAFQPSTGRLFDERTYAPADVGSRFVATAASDPDFAAVAARLGDGVDDNVGFCRATTVGGQPSQSTCEPVEEHFWFGFAPDRPVARIDLVLTSLSFTPMNGTAVSVGYDLLLLPEPDAAAGGLAALLGLAAAASTLRSRSRATPRSTRPAVPGRTRVGSRGP